MLSSLSGVGGVHSQRLQAIPTRMHWRGALIDLGVIKSVGYLTERCDQLERLQKQCYNILDGDNVLVAIESAITSVPGKQMFLGANGTHLDDSLRGWPKTLAANVAVKKPSSVLRDALVAATTLQEAAGLMATMLVQKLSHMFMLDAGDISLSSSINDIGLESIVAVELPTNLVS